MPFQPGKIANPRGRGPTLNLRTQQAIAIFDQFKFDPLEEQIKLAKSVQMAVVRGSNGERLEYRKLYALLLRELVKYCYPQLKSVEHSGLIEHVHTADELERMSDVELEAMVISLKKQREMDAVG